jgi:hypothetical protein
MLRRARSITAKINLPDPPPDSPVRCVPEIVSSPTTERLIKGALLADEKRSHNRRLDMKTELAPPPKRAPSPSRGSSTNRPLIGVAALGCLLAAGGVWLLAPDHDAALAAFLRVGLVMGALWLALPSTGESVAWAKIAPILAGSVVLIVISRKAFLFLLPAVLFLAVVFAIVLPKPKR